MTDQFIRQHTYLDPTTGAVRTVPVIYPTVVFDNIANMAAYPIPNNRNRMTVWVKTLECPWTLETTSGATPDGITVVAANGPGNWMRRSPNWAGNKSRWLLQTDWYIDAVNGDDENTGAAYDNALKTHAELERRFGQWPDISTEYSIVVISDLDETIHMAFRQLPDGIIHWYGLAQATLATGTVTGYTEAAVGVEGRLTDAAQDFTAYEGRRLRLTSGAGAGKAMTFIGPRVSGNTVVRCGRPTYFTSFSAFTAQAAAGADYAIEQQCKIRGISVKVETVDVGDTSASSLPAAVFEDFDLTGNPDTDNSYISTNRSSYAVVLMACAMGSSTYLNLNGAVRLLACSSCDSDGTRGLLEVTGGLVGLSNYSGGNVSIRSGTKANVGNVSNDVCQFDTKPMTVDNGTFVNIWAAGLYDCAFGGVLALIGSFVYSYKLWGSGNGGPGIEVESHWWYVSGNKPTITGSTPGTDDANIGGTNVAWAAVPYIEPTNNAMCVARS